MPTSIHQSPFCYINVTGLVTWISYTQIKGFQTAWHLANWQPTAFTYVTYCLLRVHITCNSVLFPLKISWEISIHFGWECWQAGFWRQRVSKATSCVSTCPTKQFTTCYSHVQQGKTNHPETLTRTIHNARDLRHLQAPQSNTCTGQLCHFSQVKRASLKLAH